MIHNFKIYNKLNDKCIYEGKNIISKAYKEQIYDLFYKNGYGSYTIDLKNDEFPLYNLEIIFKKSSKFYSVTNGEKCYIKDDKLFNYILSFDIPNDDEYKIKSEIMHELSHVDTVYKLLLNNEKSFDLIINSCKEYLKDKMQKFHEIVYLSLIDEFVSREDELYSLLNKFHSVNYDILYDEMLKTNTWSDLLKLKSINLSNVVGDLIKNVGVQLSINIINNFNKVIINKCLLKNIQIDKDFEFIKKNITSFQELNDYFNKWLIIINNRIKEHEKKLISVIDDVIKDNRIYTETYSTIKTRYIYDNENDEKEYYKYINFLKREDKLNRILKNNNTI